MKWARLHQLLIVALIAVLVWAFQDKLLPPDSSEESSGAQVPDYSMKGFVITSYNEEGSPQLYLQASEMERYEDEGLTKLLAPYLVVASKEEDSWYLLAERGELIGEGEDVWLYGNVRIEKPESGSYLLTEKVYYSASREYVETDVAVTFHDVDAKIEAVGMRAYLKEQRIEFLSNVRGQYYAK